jgi:predicted O-linked N-acetylglucosamine transferase (SPINDLY family)
MLYPLNPNWNGYQQDAFILRLRTTLDRHGIDNSRVILLGPVEHRGDVLERLRLCDIYLDSFPYSGATSLLDPLQVGLPIVARDGTSYRTLGAASLLRSIGMDHLIAPDADAYVKLALELAGSGGKRKQVRRDIQARMKKGAPFFDGPTYSRKVSAILEDIWRDYLQSGNARRS